MITIIHGDDKRASREFLLKIREDKDTDTIYAESVDLSTLLQTTQGGNLFAKNRVLTVENLFSQKSSQSLEFFKKNYKQLKQDVYIWEGKELSATQLKVFQNAQSRLFKIPQNVFGFLDSIRPKSSKNILSFHNAIKNAEAEFILFMIIRQFRLMLNLVSDGSTDEVKRLAPWQKSKILSQAKLFGEDRLKTAFNKLYRIESGVKTGSLNMSLPAAIDIFLAEI